MLPGPRQHRQGPCVALFKTREAMHSLGDERLVAAETQGEVEQACGSGEPASPPSPSDNLHGQFSAGKSGSSRVHHHAYCIVSYARQVEPAMEVNLHAHSVATSAVVQALRIVVCDR